MPYNVTVATGMARRMYVLRGGVLARDCIARTLRIDVPVTPNTVTSCSGKSLLWLGPEEWVLHVPEGAEDRRPLRLRVQREGAGAGLRG